MKTVIVQGAQSRTEEVGDTLKAREEESLSVNLQRNILDALGGLDSDTFKQGSDFSKKQSKIAKLPRGIISEIKEKLASQYPDYTAKELWPHLYAELQERELDPEDNDDVPGAEWYTYDHHDDGRKQIKFKSFANIKINK